MYLYPFKIFTISKNKRLLDVNNPQRTIGIYDAKRMNYEEACKVAWDNDACVSVLLGDLTSDVRLMVLDLDDCFIDGKMETQTKEFLKEFSEEEYELSSSGEGIHVYILTRLKLETFIVKELEGCKSFECYTNKRHIVATEFDFSNINLKVGIHDKFIQNLYDRVNEKKQSTVVQDCKEIFQGEIVKTTNEMNGRIYQRTPVTDMFTLRGLGYKDPNLISIIDEVSAAVDNSQHDARLLRKLMYYTLSFESAHEMAKKTNYYKSKDERHKKKFDDPKYIERTRRYILSGRI